MEPVTDTPADVLAEAEAAIKAAAYTLEGRYPADLSAVIVGVRDLVAISGWIAQRAGNAIAKTAPLRHDGDLAVPAAVTELLAHLQAARVTLETVDAQLTAAHNLANHFSQPLDENL